MKINSYIFDGFSFITNIYINSIIDISINIYTFTSNFEKKNIYNN